MLSAMRRREHTVPDLPGTQPACPSCGALVSKAGRRCRACFLAQWKRNRFTSTTARAASKRSAQAKLRRSQVVDALGLDHLAVPHPDPALEETIRTTREAIERLSLPPIHST